MKQFSPAFIAALIGMSIITHAQAQDVITVTPETIKEMYRYESKFPGATVTCYQAGQEVIHEPGLKDLNINESRLDGTRLDGSGFSLVTFGNNNDVFCKIVNRKEQQ